MPFSYLQFSSGISFIGLKHLLLRVLCVRLGVHSPSFCVVSDNFLHLYAGTLAIMKKTPGEHVTEYSIDTSELEKTLLDVNLPG